jgi:hypothetical protein
MSCKGVRCVSGAQGSWRVRPSDGRCGRWQLWGERVRGCRCRCCEEARNVLNNFKKNKKASPVGCGKNIHFPPIINCARANQTKVPFSRFPLTFSHSYSYSHSHHRHITHHGCNRLWHLNPRRPAHLHNVLLHPSPLSPPLPRHCRSAVSQQPVCSQYPPSHITQVHPSQSTAYLVGWYHPSKE